MARSAGWATLRPAPASPRQVAALVVGILLIGVGCTDNGTALGGDTRRALAGEDRDGNGVRDDVDGRLRLIAPSGPLAGYLTDVARNTQQVVVLDTGAADARETAFRLATVTNELVSCPPPGVDRQRARELGDEVQGSVADTAERKAKLEEFSALISGRSFPAPDCSAIGSGPAPTSTAPART
jgi:hypothetical protein